MKYNMTEIDAIIKGLERNGMTVVEVISYSDDHTFNVAENFEVGAALGLNWQNTFFVGNVGFSANLTGPWVDVNEHGLLVTLDFFTGRGLVQRKRVHRNIGVGTNTVLGKDGLYRGFFQENGIFVNRFTLTDTGYSGASYQVGITLDGLLFICK